MTYHTVTDYRTDRGALDVRRRREEQGACSSSAASDRGEPCELARHDPFEQFTLLSAPDVRAPDIVDDVE